MQSGITGSAQLCYPYGASEKDAIEKLQHDLYYVKNKSLLFDLVILLQTAEVVLWRRLSLIVVRHNFLHGIFPDLLCMGVDNDFAQQAQREYLHTQHDHQ